MTCTRCKNISPNITEIKIFCKSCFLKILRKKIKKALKGENILPHTQVDVLDDGSLQASCMISFLEEHIISKDIRILKSETRFPNKNLPPLREVVFLPLCSEDEISLFLESICSGEIAIYPKQKKNKRINLIKPLSYISYEELGRYADYFGITQKTHRKKSDLIESLIRLEKTSAHSISSMRNSIDQLKILANLPIQ